MNAIIVLVVLTCIISATPRRLVVRNCVATYNGSQIKTGDNMPTLNEQFEIYMTSAKVLRNGSDPLETFLAGAVAGAKEEREQLLQDVRGCLEQVRPVMHITVSEVMERIERRIRQRGEEAVNANAK